MEFKYFKRTFVIVPAAVVCMGIFFCLAPGRGRLASKEDFESFKISSESLINISNISALCGINRSEALIYYMLENDFFKEKKEYNREEMESFFKNYKTIKSKYDDKRVKQYTDLTDNIFDDLKTFPTDTSLNGQYYYGDSYGALRTYGGKRIHKGTDIFDSENIRGRLQIFSMTDGTVEKTGWNEKGGFRVGIRSENGIYYYYAHLDSYAEGLKEGDKIKAGAVIGYMGDTGYGKKEGTRGSFPVHLHIGISLKTRLYSGEVWLNPYPFLKCLEEGII